MINATTSAVTNWEKGRTNPRLCVLPRVFQFLGYDLLPDSAPSVGEKIKLFGKMHGLSLRKLAKKLSIDAGVAGGMGEGDKTAKS